MVWFRYWLFYCTNSLLAPAVVVVIIIHTFGQSKFVHCILDVRCEPKNQRTFTFRQKHLIKPQNYMNIGHQSIEQPKEFNTSFRLKYIFGTIDRLKTENFSHYDFPANIFNQTKSIYTYIIVPRNDIFFSLAQSMVKTPKSNVIRAVRLAGQHGRPINQFLFLKSLFPKRITEACRLVDHLTNTVSDSERNLSDFRFVFLRMRISHSIYWHLRKFNSFKFKLEIIIDCFLFTVFRFNTWTFLPFLYSLTHSLSSMQWFSNSVIFQSYKNGHIRMKENCSLML